MTYAMHPKTQAKFRAQTADPRFADVTRVPKKERCVDCGHLRTKATGQQTERGFRCHGCGKEQK